MTRRKKITYTILAILIILLIVLLWWRLLRQEEPVSVSTDVERESLTQPNGRGDDVAIAPVIDEEQIIAQTDIQSLSRTFVERYGSFSTESEFANLVDVMPLMSERFALTTQSLINSTEQDEEYYGVTTKVITIDVDEMDEESGVATATISTQREEAQSAVNNISVRYQTIVLTFVMEKGVWKVDSASWQ